MFFDRFCAIFRTGRLVAAGTADQARQGQLIETNKADADQSPGRLGPFTGIIATGVLRRLRFVGFLLIVLAQSSNPSENYRELLRLSPQTHLYLTRLHQVD